MNMLGLQQSTNNPLLKKLLYGGLLGGNGNMLGGLLGGSDPNLDPDQQAQVNRQALMSMAGNMLANSGYSPERKTFGQIFGQSMLAGQQAQQQGAEQVLRAMLIKKQLTASPGQSPSAVQEYEYAKKNGFTGSFQEWKRVAAAQPQTPSSIQEYEYFNKLDDKGKADFKSLQRSPVLPQLVTMAGSQGLLDKTAQDPTKAFTPITTAQMEIDAAVKKARAEAEAKGVGSVVGEAKGGIEKRSIAAKNVNDILDIAEPLVDVSTGSTAGAATDKVMAFFGKSLNGAEAANQLRILQGAIMFAQPRMEGPQGVLDVKLYEQMAGQIGDPTVPNDTRKAAIKTIRDLQNKYSESTVPANGATKKETAAERAKRLGL